MRLEGVQTVPAKHILQRTPAPDWFGIAYNMNLYRGCTHGCIYCDSRSVCYQHPDFGVLKVKENALITLRRDLQAASKPGVVGTGAMSDPYNPLEKRLVLTRGALSLMKEHGFGVQIATKSDLVVRDAEMLSQMAQKTPVLVNLTITCAEDAVAARVEPHVASSSARFAALSALSKAGVMTGILMMPLLPWINDTTENVRGIVERAADCGVSCIYPSFGMTLREGSREYFYRKLETCYPGLPARYAKTYGSRYEVASPRAFELLDCFAEACKKAGIAYRMPDIIDRYQGPFACEQMSLL